MSRDILLRACAPILALLAGACDPVGRGVVTEPVTEPQLAKSVHPTHNVYWSPALGPAASGDFHCVAVADFDRDGLPDIAAGGLDKRGIRVWLANGDGTWSSIDGPKHLGTPVGLAAGDLNKDGRPDLVIVGRGEVPGVRIWLNTTDEVAWKEGEPVTITQSYTAVRLADIDNDGYPDIVATRERESGQGRTGGIAVWLNLRGKGWSNDVGPISSHSYNGIAVADFNRDGHLDIAAARWGAPGGIDIWYGNGRGAWGRAKEEPAVHLDFQGIDAGDFNGDGEVDLVAATYRGDPGVSVFLNDRRGTYANADPRVKFREAGWLTTPVPLAERGCFWGVKAADLNGDGLLDVVASSFDGRGVRVWLQLPRRSRDTVPTFMEQSFRFPHQGIYYAVDAADFNDDGRPDVLAGSGDEGVKAWFQTDPAGGIKPSPRTRPPLPPDRLARGFGEVDEAAQDPDENLVFINVTRPDGRKYSEYRIGASDRLRIEIYPGRVAEPIVIAKPVEASGELLIPLVSPQALRIVDKDAKGLSPTQLRDLILEKLKETFRSPSVTVTVEEALAHRVSLLGEVRIKVNESRTGPGQYVLGGKTRVLEFIAHHGGFTERADLTKVEVRNRTGEKRVVDLFKAVFQSKLSQDVVLDDGDMVTIPSTTVSDRKIYVLGEVARPGVYALQDNVRLLEAVQLASSFNARANRRQVIVIRGDRDKPEFFQINIQEMLEAGNLSKNILLENGDVVFVPRDWVANLTEFYAWFLPGYDRVKGTTATTLP